MERWFVSDDRVYHVIRNERVWLVIDRPSMFRDAKIETFECLNLQRFHSSGAPAPWKRWLFSHPSIPLPIPSAIFTQRDWRNFGKGEWGTANEYSLLVPSPARCAFLASGDDEATLYRPSNAHPNSNPHHRWPCLLSLAAISRPPKISRRGARCPLLLSTPFSFCRLLGPPKFDRLRTKEASDRMRPSAPRRKQLERDGTVCSMWTWDVTRRVSTPPKSRRNAGWRALRRRVSQEIYAENATARFRLKRDALFDRNLASAYIRRTVLTKFIVRSMIVLTGRMET